MYNYLEKYTISKTDSIKEALIRLEKLSDDVLTLFVMDDKKMVGTLTDGDIRRALIKNTPLSTCVYLIMNTQYKFISPTEKDVKKIREIRSSGVQLLPCISDRGELINIYNIKTKKSILPLDVVLMAGGKGERLRPLTEKTPKPLLSIGDKCIIDYNIDNLISYGIRNIYVTTNYLAEKIEKHFEKEKQGVKINCIRENEYLGTIASAKLIKNLSHDEILIMNSDLFTDIDFEDFYGDFLESNTDMSVAAIPYSINIPYGVFELEGQKIKSINEKPTYNHYANAGIYLIKRELLELIPDNIFFNATDFMSLLISKKKNVIRYPLVGYWVDIGSHEDYKKVQDLVKHIKQS